LMWGTGVGLERCFWWEAKRWLGLNVMGKILTTVSRLIRLEKSEKNRKETLLSDIKKIKDIGLWRKEMRDFISQNLRPRIEEFPPPHWPGFSSLKNVLEKLSSLSPAEAVEDVDSRYCLEGVLGYRLV